MTSRQASTATVALGVAAGLTAAATLAILGTVAARIASGGSVSDFLAFYSAGHLVRTGDGARIYDPAVIESTQRLIYGGLEQPVAYPLPAFVAWVFAPLSALPFAAAYFLYGMMTAALLAGLLWAIHRQLAGVPRRERWLFTACAALALPSLTSVVSGQVDLLALLGLLAGYALLRGGRHAAAGVALSLVLIKPPLLVGVVLFLLVKRDWRALGALSAAGVPLLVVPALITGPETLIDNLRVIAHLDSGGLAASRVGVMANWRGFIVSLTGSGNAVYWAPGFAAIAAAVTAIAVSRWRGAGGPVAFDRGYSLAVLLPLLASPHVHTDNLVVGLLPAALFLRAYFDQGAPLRARRRAANATLALFISLFVLPVLAIQGISVTVFLSLACYQAVAFRWPDAVFAGAGTDVESAAVHRAA
jgi:hypothetical protein